MRWAFELVILGFQAFLITDMNGRFAIWSDGDFADDFILGAEDRERAIVSICLNKFINDMLTEGGYEKRPLRFHFFHTYLEHIGNVVWAWQIAQAEERGNVDAETPKPADEPSFG
jgi:hypothetical protein